MIAFRRPSRWPAPLRALADRLTLGGMLATCVGLLVLAKADIQAIDRVSAQAGDVAVPILATLTAPVSWIRTAGETFGGVLALEAENRRLRAQIERLVAWQSEATRLAVQNRALRGALAMPERDDTPLVTVARIVGDSGGPFLRARLVDAGLDRGVPKGAIALAPEGLVGRVVQVGARSARVLLLTDLNSRIPVRIERTGERALLAGDNGALPGLRFLPQDTTVAVGDRIVTSGDDGALPSGLPVGVIAARDGGTWRVKPFVDDAGLDVVRLVDFRPPPPPEAAITAQAGS